MLYIQFKFSSLRLKSQSLVESHRPLVAFPHVELDFCEPPFFRQFPHGLHQLFAYAMPTESFVHAQVVQVYLLTPKSPIFFVYSN